MIRLSAIIAAAALAAACSNAVAPETPSEEDVTPPAPIADEIPPADETDADDPMSHLPTPCAPAEKVCATPNMVGVCEDDGQSWRPAHCGAEQHCEDGECMPGENI